MRARKAAGASRLFHTTGGLIILEWMPARWPPAHAHPGLEDETGPYLFTSRGGTREEEEGGGGGGCAWWIIDVLLLIV